MGCIFVAKPGLQTTVQDLGRWGFQANGVSVSGAMDPMSHRLANALVGNPPPAATLEITLLGPDLEFEDERIIAVTGAEFAVTVDDRPVLLNAPFLVASGARLVFGERMRGARAYLAVSGGVNTVPVLGSRSTHVPSGMGGIDGRALAGGDRVPLGPSTGAPRHWPSRRAPFVPAFLERTGHLRLLPGPHLDRFPPDSLEALLASAFVVTRASDRMGYRLDGPTIRHTRGPDIISEPTPVGALQVPGSGQPVLLMADRQTCGGYAQLATVIAADLSVAAQLALGDSVTFEVCTRAQAVAALIAEERALLAVEVDVS